LSLDLRPCPVRRAEKIVEELHRHLPRIEGGLFATTVYVEGRLVGVAVASRPRARQSQDGFTVEITRCATDGHPNACSRLYAALCRAAAAIGHRRALTYTRPEEPGTSLRAAGFVDDGVTDEESWDRLGRRRKPRADEKIPKRRWVRWLQEPRRARVERRRGKKAA
jgi:hypothetical protein